MGAQQMVNFVNAFFPLLVEILSFCLSVVIYFNINCSCCNIYVTSRALGNCSFPIARDNVYFTHNGDLYIFTQVVTPPLFFFVQWRERYNASNWQMPKSNDYKGKTTESKYIDSIAKVARISTVLEEKRHELLRSVKRSL